MSTNIDTRHCNLVGWSVFSLDYLASLQNLYYGVQKKFPPGNLFFVITVEKFQWNIEKLQSALLQDIV